MRITLDVDVGIVRAALGVAETGSLWLSEGELQVNALTYLAQHLVALLDSCDVVGNLHHAYRDPRFKTARYAVLVTGAFRDSRHRRRVDSGSAGCAQSDGTAGSAPGEGARYRLARQGDPSR
jgi:hypothetical protein